MVYDGNQVVAGVRAGRVQEGLDVKAIHRECHCRAELGGKVGVVAEALQLDAKHLQNCEPEGAHRWRLGKKEALAARDKVATLFAPVAVLPVKQLGVAKGLQARLEGNLAESKRLANRVDDRAEARLSLGSIEGNWDGEVEEGILLDRNRLASEAHNFGAQLSAKRV